MDVSLRKLEWQTAVGEKLSNVLFLLLHVSRCLRFFLLLSRVKHTKSIVSERKAHTP